MRLFASEKIVGLMDKLGMEEGQVLEHPWLSKALENAQKRVETHNFEIRKHLLEYDNVMNRQREVIYNLRRSILESQNVKDLILEAIGQVSDDSVVHYLFASQEDNSWDFDGLQVYFKSKFNYDLSAQQEKIKDLSQQEIQDLIFQDLSRHYDAKENDIDPQHLRHMERMLLLHTIDSKWKDHLYAMDQMKEGIGLRSFAQRDPLIEYKREGFEMFQLMYSSINQEVSEIIFKIQPVSRSQQAPKGVFSSLPQHLIHDEISSLGQVAAQRTGRPAPQQMPQSQDPSSQAPTPSAKPYRKAGPKIGRNDPCPCGSGKKYKKCCGQ